MDYCGGGGAKGMLAPLLSNYWVGGLGTLYLRLWFTESNDTCILASYISNLVTFKISMLDLGTKSSVQALGVSNPGWTQSLDRMAGLPNSCQVQSIVRTLGLSNPVWIKS